VKLLKRDGAANRYIGGDDPAAAASIREVDIRKKVYLRATPLAERLNISTNKAKSLRDFLGIDNDPTHHHLFEFDATKIPYFSNNAVRLMQAALDEGRLDEACVARKR
jgi:hypothetical protein